MFSQTAEYALRAAVCLAQPPAAGEPQTTQQIAATTKVPAPYLSKCLQIMARAGLVKGSRGLGGGCELARDAGEMTVLEVVQAVDPIRRIHSCPLGLEAHRDKLCPLHRRMDEALANIEQTLGATTLAEVVAEDPAHKPLCEVAAS